MIVDKYVIVALLTAFVTMSLVSCSAPPDIEVTDDMLLDCVDEMPE